MSKVQTKKNLALVTQLIDELKPILFLEGWTIVVKLYDGPSADNTEALAMCSSKNQYKDTYLDFFPSFFEQDLERQRSVVLHELLHIITAIQNGLIQSARGGNAVSPAEASYAYEEETSWIEKIISALL